MFDDIDIVDVLSDIMGMMWDKVALNSWIEWFDVKKPGCDVISSSCSVIHIVCVMSYIQCVLYHWYSVCDQTDTDMEGVMSDIVVVLS